MSDSITVFTAAYNYGEYLHRVYTSLEAQSYKNFEWVIVDDCSTDNTREVVESWLQDKNDFPIRYFRQSENKGKMAAMNRGVREASYELFISIDADDELMPDALAIYMKHWDSIDKETRLGLSALVGLCKDQHGELVGNKFPSDPLIADFYETTFKYKIVGDKLEMYRTAVLREFPYYEGVDRHVIHSATYFDMAEKYKLYCFNEIVRIYYRDEDGKVPLSKRTKKLRFLKGRQYYAEMRINKYFPRIPSVKFKFLTFISYTRYSWHIGISLSEMMQRIEKGKNKVAFIAILPLSLSLIVMDKIQKRA
ncbi:MULTISPECIES: glycosyltransferase family 2 protein [unclassified Oceanispirochaeta]|uniref:glycosyltransferase family 2 protein n=1 Tax=unclassified Oceanispirochaeta TaxID=2635722 RepID=UPI000E098188|nr:MULTISPECIES: glycosyltransferase family 2 protein [unclassified Oceanispirochaeta]MBF9017764.1 glycosyltransferase family 2 protein [Oceanispirochaeta sp. M2]NPD74328.1 glycosyltransferase family 2 protein [Oceanispirochaeta sp. M1]RDG29808.1 glycosyltransferase family 2 protein [Oceanispirochaeta sp. M1]